MTRSFGLQLLVPNTFSQAGDQHVGLGEFRIFKRSCKLENRHVMALLAMLLQLEEAEDDTEYDRQDADDFDDVCKVIQGHAFIIP